MIHSSNQSHKKSKQSSPLQHHPLQTHLFHQQPQPMFKQSPSTASQIQQQLNSSPLLIFCQGMINNNNAKFLFDSGLKINIINSEFVQRINLNVQWDNSNNYSVSLANGSTSQSPIGIAHAVYILLPDWNGSHDFIITKIGSADAILGIKWLATIDPTIHFSDQTIQIQTNTTTTTLTTLKQLHTHSHTCTPNITPIKPRQLLKSLCADKLENIFVFFVEKQQNNIKVNNNQPQTFEDLINRSLKTSNSQLESLLSQTEQQHLAMLRSQVRELLMEFKDVFPSELPNELLLKCLVDYAITLLPNAEPVSAKPIHLPLIHEQALCQHIQEGIKKGLIVPLNSPYSCPIIIIMKKDGSFQVCIDYRTLNKITKKDCYPLLLISGSSC